MCTTVAVPNNPAAAVNIPPGCYNWIDIGNNATVRFQPGGLYWMNGSLTTGNSPHLFGSQLMLYFAGTAPATQNCIQKQTNGGCINIPNGGDITWSAQTSGPYTGILFFQSRTNQISATFNNTGNYNMSGAMYFPVASVSYGNAGTSNDCTLLVAQTLTIGGGNSTFSNTCSAYGGAPFLTVTLAE
jgi:hypothetical protein